jgi:hypothetical protein
MSTDVLLLKNSRIKAVVGFKDAEPETGSARRTADESLDANELSRRRELVKLEVAAIKIISKDGARMLRPNLISLDQPCSRLSSSQLSLRIEPDGEQNIRRSSSIAELQVNAHSLSSPLPTVHESLNRLWDSEATRARILARARRKTMALNRSSATAVTSSASYMNRRNSTSIEVNWYAEKGRTPFPFLGVGSNAELRMSFFLSTSFFHSP